MKIKLLRKLAATMADSLGIKGNGESKLVDVKDEIGKKLIDSGLAEAATAAPAARKERTK